MRGLNEKSKVSRVLSGARAALGESAPELLEVAPFRLVGEQHVEKLGVAPLLSERLAETFAEGVEHAGQLQARQLGLQEC